MRSVLLLTLACAACRGGAGPGRLTAQWAGVERGSFAAPLSATHCPQTGVVSLLAVRGDTGVGGVLYLATYDSVAAGEYPIVPGSVAEEPRPGAAAAVRWFGVTSIAAWEGLSGTIRLERRDTLLSGTIDVRLQALNHTDTLRLTGGFSGVPLVVADSTCRVTLRRNRL